MQALCALRAPFNYLCYNLEQQQETKSNPDSKNLKSTRNIQVYASFCLKSQTFDFPMQNEILSFEIDVNCIYCYIPITIWKL
ncbi:hypothetical protein HanRHA438_Chr01g0013891 [Helianthus annuus]|nr:hypothetical protein HanRHA438_Chr01g0013891 [Helianthus annuus]